MTAEQFVARRRPLHERELLFADYPGLGVDGANNMVNDAVLCLPGRWHVSHDGIGHYQRPGFRETPMDFGGPPAGCRTA
jgi:hypothetical protein